MIIFQPYDDHLKEFKDSVSFKIPEKVESVYFSYDGGRVSLFVNGKEVFKSAFAGNAFDLEIDNKKIDTK